MSQPGALITGGARGIGRAIALDLAARHWSLAICYRTSEQEATETSKQIAERGGQVLSKRCDVSDPILARAFVQEVEGTWGRVDALINCAGPYHRVNLMEESPEGWKNMFDHNLHPIFYLSQAAAPGMKSRTYGRCAGLPVRRCNFSTDTGTPMK